MANLKEEIKEIVDIITLVPDSLKVMCFELLLKDAIAKRHSPAKSSAVPAHVAPDVELKKPKPAALTDESGNEAESAATSAPGVQPKVNGGSDIAMSDLHMKTKRFMTISAVTLDHINNVFYKEGDKFDLLITDFGAKSMADAQMRIAMLQALHQALIDGEFTTTVEAVREECKIRKSYDAANFTTNFKFVRKTAAF